MPLGKCLEQAAGSLIASGGFFVWPARRASSFWLIYSTDLSQIVPSCDWYEPSSGIPHLLLSYFVFELVKALCFFEGCCKIFNK
ncbi:hypothetical protein [Lactobacillus porci]|uniref:hypothetical protein n=1 Tax=Lactobacillus porci TaxID=2012477 RepID=UPI0039963F17